LQAAGTPSFPVVTLPDVATAPDEEDEDECVGFTSVSSSGTESAETASAPAGKPVVSLLFAKVEGGNQAVTLQESAEWSVLRQSAQQCTKRHF
jgi:hypothetical protein